MSQDESFYPKPEEFIPDRYLDPGLSSEKADLMDPKNIAFGFGRR